MASSSSSSLLKVFGVPLSQPFRSVVWTLLQKQTPFEIQITVPGATNKMGSLHESFLNRTRGRTGTVPVLQEGGGAVAISESPAILAYLCESRGWEDLYGQPGTISKAQIDSYLHWHHTHTRRLAALTRPYLRPDLQATPSEQDEEAAHQVLTSLDRDWLRHDEYMASEHCSIADILAYEEIAQATLTGVLSLTNDYPNLEAWCRRQEAKDHYDAAHRSLQTLGSLTDSNETPMMKRLGAATKEGIKAIQEVQATYHTNE